MKNDSFQVPITDLFQVVLRIKKFRFLLEGPKMAERETLKQLKNVFLRSLFKSTFFHLFSTGTTGVK